MSWRCWGVSGDVATDVWRWETFRTSDTIALQSHQQNWYAGFSDRDLKKYPLEKLVRLMNFKIQSLFWLPAHHFNILLCCCCYYMRFVLLCCDCLVWGGDWCRSWGSRLVESSHQKQLPCNTCYDSKTARLKRDSSRSAKLQMKNEAGPQAIPDWLTSSLGHFRQQQYIRRTMETARQ